jgi:hypothetical protein
MVLGNMQRKPLELPRKSRGTAGPSSAYLSLLSARFASATDSPEKIRTLSGGWLCVGRDYKIFPHFASISRASSADSAEVGGNLSRYANDRRASMIALEGSPV